MEPSWTQGQVFFADKRGHPTLPVRYQAHGRVLRFKRFRVGHDRAYSSKLRHLLFGSCLLFILLPHSALSSLSPLLLLFLVAAALSSNSLPSISSFSSFNELPDLLFLPKCRYPRLRRYHFPIKVKSYALSPKRTEGTMNGNGETAVSYSRIADVTTRVDRYAR